MEQCLAAPGRPPSASGMKCKCRGDAGAQLSLQPRLSVKMTLNSFLSGMDWRILTRMFLEVAEVGTPGCTLGMGPSCLFSAAAR